MTKLGVGIIGAGQIAPLHAAGYLSDDRVRLHAVCDTRETLAVERALEWKTERYYTDYRELLADDQIHVVDILTPHNLHARIADEALRAGKHVNVQRPLALNLTDADSLIRQAKSRSLCLACGDWTTFTPSIRDAKTYLETGEIGEPVSVQTKVVIGAPEGGWEVRPESWLWRFDELKCGGGPFLFDAIYSAFAAACHLFGGVDRVQASIGRTEIYSGYYVDAPAAATWRHKDQGCVGSLNVSYCSELYVESSHYPLCATMEIAGTKGLIWARYTPANLRMTPALQMYRDGRMFSFGEVKDDWAASFQAATKNFIDAVLGEDTLRLSPDTAREILRMTLAARESSTTERVHKLY
jgi:predicted dehydrogenase